MTEHLSLPLYIKAIKSDVEEVAAKTQAIGHAVCDRNGEFLTDSLPETVCKELVQICNKHYYNSRKDKTASVLDSIIFSAVLPFEPVELPQKGVIVKGRGGSLLVIEPHWYQRYRDNFYKYTAESELFLSVKIPIEEKCQVTGLFYTSSQGNKTVSAYVESLLDCLEYSGIIKTKSRYLITSIDGCRVFTDEANPRIEIFIRKQE